MCYKKNDLSVYAFITLFLMLAPDLLHAQSAPSDAADVFSESMQMQRKAMYVLGSWATINIISGAYGTFKNNGKTKYFHQMNAGWNTVNLAIAGFSLLSLSQSDPAGMSANEIFGEMNGLDKFLLLNAGLDVGYIAAGAWLWDRGIRKNSERLEGYGRSLIIQGSFLLLFDAAFYLLHSPLTTELTSGITMELSYNAVRINF